MLRKFIPELNKLTTKCNVPHYINGKFVKPIGSISIPVISPSKDTIVTNVTLDDNDALKSAINVSKTSFNTWSNVSIGKRVEGLIEWNNWIADNKDNIATIISAENGKTFEDAQAEVVRGIEVVRYALSAPSLLKGDYSVINDSLEIHTKKQPLGVVTGLMPFNFPAMIPLWMIPLAVVCGNSIIIKSSEKCPMTPLFLAYGATKSLPPGVVNVIHGGVSISSDLISHKDIEAVSFVGSTTVGKKVYDTVAKHGKRSQINMGAKNHAVVMPDCNYEETADSIISAFVMGQRCMAISVLIVVDGADSIVDLIKKKLETIDPVDDMGPLITAEAKSNLIKHVENSIEYGAELTHGDYNATINDNVGNYMEPLILENVNTNMDVYKNELFGPVLSIIKVSTLDDAIEIVNKNEYGNGTSIFTNDMHEANKYENETKVTQCGVNVPIPVSPPYYSWTSSKESYRGSHYIYGPSSFDFYSQEKTTMTKFQQNGKQNVEQDKISVTMPTFS